MAKLLVETVGFNGTGLPPVECIYEDIPNIGRKYKIHGIFLQANRINGNKRFYPSDTMAEAVRLYNQGFILHHRALGELGHPVGPKINLPLVSHKITELRQDGNDWWGTAEILDTPNGKIVKAFIDGGIKMGTSSRGLGSTSQRNGVDYVNSDFKLATAGDIVFDPSAPDAFVKGLMEGKEWVFDESTEEWIDTNRKLVRKMSKTEIENRTLDLFEGYLKSLIKS